MLWWSIVVMWCTVYIYIYINGLLFAWTCLPRLFRWSFTVRLKRHNFNYMPHVRFEHVALRFLGEGRKAGLLEYLRCRLKVADDQVGGTRYKMCYSMLQPFRSFQCLPLATEKPSAWAFKLVKVTRSLLSVWAVEISLARLNELRQES